MSLTAPANSKHQTFNLCPSTNLWGSLENFTDFYNAIYNCTQYLTYQPDVQLRHSHQGRMRCNWLQGSERLHYLSVTDAHLDAREEPLVKHHINPPAKITCHNAAGPIDVSQTESYLQPVVEDHGIHRAFVYM